MTSLRLKRLISSTLYSLKMAFGSQVSIYRVVESTTDYPTGVKSIETQARLVRNAIPLPEQLNREVYQSVSYLASSRSFASLGGGQFHAGERAFIFDGRDIRGYEPNLADWLVYENTRFDITSIETLASNAGYLIVAKQVAGQPSGGVVSENVNHSTGLTDGSEAA